MASLQKLQIRAVSIYFERLVASLLLLSVSSLTNGCMAASVPADVSRAPVISVKVFVNQVHQGEVLEIRWNGSNVPDGTVASLFPVKVLTGHVLDPIAQSLPPNGRLSWRVPVFRPQPIMCAVDPTGGCVGNMNPGTKYRILIQLYPKKAVPGIDVIGQAESLPFQMLMVH